MEPRHKHRLMPISPTVYNITLIIDEYCIPAATQLKNAS